MQETIATGTDNDNDTGMGKDAVIQNILEDLSRGEDANDPDTIATLSSGIVLKIKPFSQILLIKVMEKYPAPVAPMIEDEERGVTMANVQDPEYLRSHMEWMGNLMSALRECRIMLGTELISVPDGIEGPDGEEWVATLEHFSLPVSTVKSVRYLQWMETIAITNTQDLQIIIRKQQRLMGVKEDDVAAAISGFPGYEGRGADTGNGAEPTSRAEKRRGARANRSRNGAGAGGATNGS